MTISPYSDHALLINFEQKIHPTINAIVVALNQALLSSSKSLGVLYTIPAYCSLTVVYDPAQTSYNKLAKAIEQIDYQQLKTIPSTIHKIPVCYEPPYALDMAVVSQQTGLSSQKVISLHQQTTFQVYMLGFLPGFAYLGKLPKALATKRKVAPRLKVPKGAVGLAGLQTGIYPSVSPGGWQLIGQSPISVFNLQKDNPFLFNVGDQVQFYAIDGQQFEKLAKLNKTFD